MVEHIAVFRRGVYTNYFVNKKILQNTLLILSCHLRRGKKGKARALQ